MVPALDAEPWPFFAEAASSAKAPYQRPAQRPAGSKITNAKAEIANVTTREEQFSERSAARTPHFRWTQTPHSMG
jgi:hypothetical protein